MNMLLERVNKVADEIINENLFMDMTEQQIKNSIYEDGSFVLSMTIGCPTSFLTCC